MSDSDWLPYGATGYSGRCIAAEAAHRALKPILAGRNSATVHALTWGVQFRRRIAVNDMCGRHRVLRSAWLMRHSEDGGTCTEPEKRPARSFHRKICALAPHDS